MKWLYLVAALAAALLLLREALLVTRSRRVRRANATPFVELPLSTKLVRWAALPVFLLMVGLIAVAGILVGAWVGPH